ncbi:hypothetical protein CAOG_01346 [Capsaspora owczarzaki ATCC 30864]|uniref:SYO1-like TPR repeats domain-containing protein n=1 Tax=Capsaspora owczarzaki (strain ATCC 30864) TaxID=595528 RepID=A0A0D2WK63_CAPO3|nr:hypothetical protein CAOG_01346 [Capsaspora owczarzaki ATCC 30864]KJE89948.1 hypothetical protein CAOG_001346 [Capsaspora owczarzaki ATCC 30864]|eukprot:XP_004349866.1 hypothetical protein CAOG_01346 [Capsaspora owczarzaki ATCC 30864]
MGKLPVQRTKARNMAQTPAGLITIESAQAQSESDEQQQLETHSSHVDENPALLLDGTAGDAAAAAASSSSSSSALGSSILSVPGAIAGRVSVPTDQEGLFDDSHVDAFGAPIVSNAGSSAAAAISAAMHASGAQAALSDLESAGARDGTARGTPKGITDLLALLTSSEPSEREYACGGVAHLVLDAAEALPAIVRLNGVPAILACFHDPELAVRLEAAGAVRNICLVSGPDGCQTLVGMGLVPLVMEAIAAASQLMVSNAQTAALVASAAPSEDQAEQARETQMIAEQVAEHLEHLINILLQMCENSEAAVALFHESQLITLLVQLVGTFQTVPMTLALVAAQCVQTVTDDSATALTAFSYNASLTRTLDDTLTVLLTSADANAQVLTGVQSQFMVVVAGALQNVHTAWPAEQYAAIQAHVLHALQYALSKDVIAAVTGLVSQLSSIEAAANTPHRFANAQSPTVAVEASLSSVQMALEVLTNLCSVDGSEDGTWEDVAEDAPGDVDEEVELTAEQIEQASAGEQQQQLPEALLAALYSHGIPQRIVTLASTVPASLFQLMWSHRIGRTLMDRLATVQSRALSFLSNLISFSSIEYTTQSLGIPTIGTLWQQLLVERANIASKTGYGLEELHDSITAALWAVVRRVKQSCPTAPLETTPAQIHELYTFGRASENEAVRINVVGIVGVLAQLFEQAAMLGDIALGLLAVVTEDASLVVVAEALDVIFDAFAEPEVNQAISHANLVATLQQIAPVFKQRIRAERRSLPSDAVGRLSDVQLNLSRFIKYKQAQA